MPTVAYRNEWNYAKYIVTKRLYEGDLANLSYVENFIFYGKIKSIWWQLIPMLITVTIAKLTGLSLEILHVYGFWSTILLPIATYSLMNLYCKDKKLIAIGTISSTLLIMSNISILIIPEGIILSFRILLLYGIILLYKRGSIKGFYIILISIFFLLFSYSFNAIFYSLVLFLMELLYFRTFTKSRLKLSIVLFITFLIVFLTNYFYFFLGEFNLLKILESGIMKGIFAYSLKSPSIPYLYSPKEFVSPQLIIAIIVSITSIAYIYIFKRSSFESNLFLTMSIVSGLVFFLNPRLVSALFYNFQLIFCGSIIQVAEKSKRKRILKAFLFIFMILTLSTPLLTSRTAYAKYETFSSDYIGGIHWVERETQGRFVSDLKFATVFYALTGLERGIHNLDNLDEHGDLTKLWYSSSLEGTIEYMVRHRSRYIIITSDMSVMFIVCDYYRQPINEKIEQIQSSELFILLYKNNAIEVYELNQTGV